MANHHVGKKVKVTRTLPGVHQGEQHRVTSVHSGVFYGVGMSAGTAFVPESFLDPDHDGDVDTPGAPDVDAGAGTPTAGMPPTTAALIARLSPATIRRVLADLGHE